MDDVILVFKFLFWLTQKPCLMFEDPFFLKSSLHFCINRQTMPITYFLELQIFDTMCISLDVRCTCKLTSI